MKNPSSTIYLGSLDGEDLATPWIVLIVVITMSLF